jgi:hypothetical protein
MEVEALACVRNVFTTQLVVEENVEEALTIVRYVVEAFACVRNVPEAYENGTYVAIIPDVEANVPDAYVNVGKVDEIQFVVEENVDEALACVRNVFTTQLVVEDMTDDAYPNDGNVPEAYVFVTYPVKDPEVA